MSKTIPYLRLDLRWRDDPKVTLLRQRHGRKGEFAWVAMMCCMSECSGCVNLEDEVHMASAVNIVKTTPENIRRYCEWFCEVGLINEQAYRIASHVTCSRAAREQRAREGRSARGTEMAKRVTKYGKAKNPKQDASFESGKPCGKQSGKTTIAEAVSDFLDGCNHQSSILNL